MIYGDNPQKINEREDALGLKTYTYVPQVAAVMQAGNLYVYCTNNPLTFVDKNGQWTFALGADFAAAFGIRIATGTQIVIDNKGNVGFIWYRANGIGTPSASIAATASFTSAKDIYCLKGKGAALGGGISWLGAEFSAAGGVVVGVTISATPLSAVPLEAHSEYVKTTVEEIRTPRLKNAIYRVMLIKAANYYKRLDYREKELLGIAGGL